MRSRALQPQASVCQICNFVAARHSVLNVREHGYNQHAKLPQQTQSMFQYQNSAGTRKMSTLMSRTCVKPSNISTRPLVCQNVCRNSTKTLIYSQSRRQGNVDEEIQDAINIRDKTLSNSTAPPQREIKKALSYCASIAEKLVEPPDQARRADDGSAASALLSVDESAAAKSYSKSQKFSPATQRLVDQLSRIVYSILEHPAVFITPSILRQYVNIQSRLRKPKTFPHIFSLYASKPIPEERTSPIKYSRQNPNKAANAVGTDVADRALQTAIQTKQLVVAMDIIEATYATKAFRRSLFIRKGLLPATGFAVAPVAAYAVASQLSAYQSTMDPGLATNVAFAGILAYMGFTATIGIVAVTTANDQMDRVTWSQGMPLRERWIREPERAAIDKVAGAWGFQETWRRGEEEGEEWEALREWIGRKGMILDRVELMEGME